VIEPTEQNRQDGQSVEDTVMSLDIVDKSLQACDRTKLSGYRVKTLLK